MKYVLWIVIVALIGFGAYWFMNNNAEDAADADTQSEEMNGNNADAEVSVGVDLGSPDQSFTMSGENFEFSQTEMRVTEGDVVRVRLTSTEGLHDWVLDEFDAQTAQASEGETVEVTFVASAAGTYEYYCSVGNHRAQGMVGTLIVEPAE